MKKKTFLTLLTFICLMQFTFAQDEARLLRFPTISGDKIVFSYAGDLYSVASVGGMARKITTHEGFEVFPKFSPDGKSLAFTGQYDGNTEVYLMPAEGGIPKRLTFTATLDRDDLSDRMGPNNIVMAWSPDSKSIIYRSRRFAFNAFRGQLFNVSKDGGMSTEIPLYNGGFCSYSPDGKKLAFNRVFREFRTWKYYKGGMADDIWIYDFETKKIENITNNNAQDIEPMWCGDEIYFLSDRDRTMNMFSYNVKTKETKKVTNFTDYDIKFPSANGDKIVFEQAGYIHVFDVKTQKEQKVTIQIADDGLSGRDVIKDATQNIFSFDLSPSGERLAFGARGDVFSVPVKKGVTRNLTQSSSANDRNVQWSPDGRYVAYISDMSGEFEIYIQKPDGTEKPIQITKDADTYIFNIEWSPDSKKIAYNDRKKRLRYVDISTKTPVLVDTARNENIRGFSWSPDSKWIVYTRPDERVNKICLYNLETKKITEVTDDWYSAGGASFSSDGKYLLFTSSRDFNPIYNAVEWNFAYQNMSKIYFCLLSKSTVSPFVPENDEVKIIEENKTSENKDKPKDKDKKDEPKPVADIKIDLDGIKDRIVVMPCKPSNYGNIYCIDTKVYFVDRPSGGEATIKVYDLKDKKETRLGEKMNFLISANHKKMLVIKGKDYAVIDMPSAEINIKETVDLSNLKVKINNQKEWKQIFDEAWRQYRDFFYVPTMHGVNWKNMHDKYSVLLPYVKCKNDLNYLIGEMIAELSIGHSYINGGDKPQVDRIAMGLLGAKIEKHSSGYFQVKKILTGQNWNNTMRSPLTETNVNVKESDFIISINGKPLNDVNDIYELLVGSAGKQIEMTVNSQPSENGSRKVVVVPIENETELYYYNWVQANIKKVSDATNGQVGYIHIPDMGVEGLNEFVKYFYPQLNKKALIIDDRGNGGGNVSPMILERLSRVVYRSTMSRNSSEGSTVPREALLGPKVCLIDNYSASDGDLFPYGFKKLKLGKLVGKRTWGGVVGISGPLVFVDGTDLRKPEYASYSADISDWIIEGHGVDPDIDIDNNPSDEYNGKDAQLDEAIKVILEEVKNFKQSVPPIPNGPDKTK